MNLIRPIRHKIDTKIDVSTKYDQINYISIMPNSIIYNNDKLRQDKYNTITINANTIDTNYN